MIEQIMSHMGHATMWEATTLLSESGLGHSILSRGLRNTAGTIKGCLYLKPIEYQLWTKLLARWITQIIVIESASCIHQVLFLGQTSQLLSHQTLLTL